MVLAPDASASFAFMFNKVYEFEAGKALTQGYRLVIANGYRAAVWRGKR